VRGVLFRHIMIACAVLAAQCAQASTSVYGRVNLSVEQRKLPSGRQAVGERLALRLALALRLGRGDLHLNAGTASAYSAGLPAEGRARQLTTGYNYHLSTRTKVYVLVSRLRDQGQLSGNWQAMAAGLRHNF
jgi:predicted porin